MSPYEMMIANNPLTNDVAGIWFWVGVLTTLLVVLAYYRYYIG